MSWLKPGARIEKAALDEATAELAKAQREGKSALERLLRLLDVPIEREVPVLTARERRK